MSTVVIEENPEILIVVQSMAPGMSEAQLLVQDPEPSGEEALYRLSTAIRRIKTGDKPTFTTPIDSLPQCSSNHSNPTEEPSPSGLQSPFRVRICPLDVEKKLGGLAQALEATAPSVTRPLEIRESHPHSRLPLALQGRPRLLAHLVVSVFPSLARRFLFSVCY